MQNYREILYKDYFSTQLGRGMELKIEEKFLTEKNQFLLEIIPQLPPNKDIKVLDIGCGIGSLLSVLKDSGYKNCTGIDLSEEQIQVAHTNGIVEAQLGDLVPFLEKNKNA
jgi:2-polyprenyl-3-methyl-5-hydroxy-6-metoxy-1,4-benzoquinol methylase